MSFYNEIQKYDWQTVTNQIEKKTANDVQRALQKDVLTINDFQALISPAAEPYLEQIVRKSMIRTQKRFGKTIQLYIPMYISNYCTNNCIYCGFNHSNEIERTVLSIDDILAEAEEIKKLGFEHILLVTGEDNKHCGVQYMKDVMKALKDKFALLKGNGPLTFNKAFKDPVNLCEIHRRK